MYNINFIACAVGEVYESFLPPFAFFALLNNPNSHVEILVEDPDAFKSKFSEEIDSIKKYNNNFLIRNLTFKLNNNFPNTYRFFETPLVESKFTYITDVDIMYMEDVLMVYLENWKCDLPYNNIIRQNDKDHLSGLHMVRNEKYYTDDFKKCQLKYYGKNEKTNDEIILYNMCEEIHGLPPQDFQFRPVLGIHFSPNRGVGTPYKIATNQKYYDMFLTFSEGYNNLFKFKCFKDLLTRLTSEFGIK